MPCRNSFSNKGLYPVVLLHLPAYLQCSGNKKKLGAAAVQLIIGQRQWVQKQQNLLSLLARRCRTCFYHASFQQSCHGLKSPKPAPGPKQLWASRVGGSNRFALPLFVHVSIRAPGRGVRNAVSGEKHASGKEGSRWGLKTSPSARIQQ